MVISHCRSASYPEHYDVVRSDYILHLHTVSSGLPHPHAWQNTLVRQSEPLNVTDVFLFGFVKIHVIGVHIGVLSACLVVGHSEEIRTSFEVWNWQTGVKKSVSHDCCCNRYEFNMKAY